jgi:hypothetical protein
MSHVLHLRYDISSSPCPASEANGKANGKIIDANRNAEGRLLVRFSAYGNIEK